MKKIVLSLVSVAILFSCTKEETTTPQLSLNDQFNVSTTGWSADFADYPVGEETFYELSTKKDAKLPAPLDTLKKGFRVSGNNHSDDLFMFLTKKMTGLKASQTYKGTFEVEFASNAPDGSVGVGGSPAESVYMGIGLTSIEPKKVANTTTKSYEMNIKKMQQATSGQDMKVIGNIANGTTENKYKIIKRTGEFTGKSDANGNLWVIVGTDSGFEATTTLYYTGVKVNLTEVTAAQ
ncbi:hypothetical protein [Emticicia sp. BO119]|uniref:hypothetical protein n=1 Tax=Emticicia sp. BO119 TaxID=2757768 RepID=UPI0015F0AFF4|nr:hypothetical protein [Emticicia sp. BO119]MBA4851938.1 hypothetical protein [Emticicia sp. BO119]